MGLNTYRVGWFLEVEADTPTEAARDAWDTVRAAFSETSVFTVWSADGSACCVDALTDMVYPSDLGVKEQPGTPPG